MSSRPHNSRRHIVDHASVAGILRSKKDLERHLEFHWQFYAELAFQRAQIYPALLSALQEQATPFLVEGWQRAVKYRYSQSPLLPTGSMRDPGGRFNIGAIDPSRYTVFPALYLASDRQTAEDELFARDGKGSLLSYQELALIRTGSTTFVSVSGALRNILDVRVKKTLASFTALIKDFKISDALHKAARRINLKVPSLVLSGDEMQKVLFMKDWRSSPMLWDVPSGSQIFGQISADAGIEGIVYPSTLTNRPCLAVFPQSFRDSDSCLAISDPVPPLTTHIKLDKDTEDRNFKRPFTAGFYKDLVLLREGIPPSDVQVGKNFGGTALLESFLARADARVPPAVRLGLAELRLLWNLCRSQARWFVREL